MSIFKHTILASILLLQGCNAQKKELPVPVEETISIIDQVTTSIKEDKATVIGLFVKPQRSTSCEKIYVEISVFNEQLNHWEGAIEFNITNNSKDAIGGPSMSEQLFMASLNRLEEFAISGIGCKPYQGKMSKNYQIYATFKPQYGKINIIGTIEQNILAKGVNIYDFKENTEMAKHIIKTEKPSLENYVVPAKLDVQLWDKLQGGPLKPAEIMADKNGSKSFILYQIEIQKRTKNVENASEAILNEAAKGTFKVADAVEVRELGLRVLDNQREDVYRFYDLLSAGTTINDAAIYTELMTAQRGVALEQELARLSGLPFRTASSAFSEPLKNLRNSGRLKGLKSKSRIAELETRKPLREAVTKTEGPYLKLMYPFDKFRSVKSQDKQIELTKNYLDALDELELFDAKRHVKRTGLNETNAEVYVVFHKNMMKARRDYLMDFAERAHEEDYLMSKNYHTYKRVYTRTKEDIDLLKTELFSAI